MTKFNCNVCKNTFFSAHTVHLSRPWAVHVCPHCGALAHIDNEYHNPKKPRRPDEGNPQPAAEGRGGADHREV